MRPFHRPSERSEAFDQTCVIRAVGAPLRSGPSTRLGRGEGKESSNLPSRPSLKARIALSPRFVHPALMKASRLLVALWLTTLAWADVLPPAQDSSSSKGKLSAASGRATTLPVSATRKGFVLFNLGSLPVGVAAGDIASARLRVYFPSARKPGDLGLFTVTSAWDEKTAATEPGVSVAPIAQFPAATVVAKQFVEVDVTSTVQDWLASPGSNFGFAFLAAGTTNVTIGAKEGSGTGYPCELEIEISRGIADGSIANSQLANASFTLSGSGGIVGGSVSLGGVLPISLGSDLTLGGTTSGTFSGDGSALTVGGDTLETHFVKKTGDLMTGGLNIRTADGNFGFVHDDGTVSVGSYVDASGGWLGTISNNPLFFFANNSAPFMTLTPAGKFGIGTTTPGAALDVHSASETARFELTDSASTATAASVLNPGQGVGLSIQMTNASSGGRGLDVSVAGVGPGVFSTSAGGNGVWGITNSISTAGVIGDNSGGGEAVVGRVTFPSDPNKNGNGVGAVVGRNDLMNGYGVRGFVTKSGAIGVLGQAGISGGVNVAGRFENVNAANGTDILQAATNGTGYTATFTNSNNSSASKGIRIATTAGQGGNALNIANGTVALSYQHPYASNTTVDDSILVVTTAGNVTIPTGSPLADGTVIYVVNNAGAVITITNTTAGAFNVNPGRAGRFLFVSTVSGANWIPVSP